MIGKVLNNRYEIVEKIGEGGMAEVYKAKCKVLNRFVAIKVLKQQYINDETFAEKFKRESQAAASLSHPNIVNVYDVGYMEDSNGKTPYIVMEYIKGKTLKEVITENNKLNISDTIFYSLQIAEAIEHAHSNFIIHRDIKPHNIMINDNNRVKVTDFGIARAVTSSTVTIGSDTLGSVHYISPEQARGGYTDEKSDIYSLGIVMYEMITGKLPFNAETPVAVALKHIQEEIIHPREIDPSISKELESIILKCVSKNQSDRYQKMSYLINDLKNIDILKVPIINENKVIEDSPTMVIPIIKDEDIVENNHFVKEKDDKLEEDDENKSGTKTTILAILLAFLVVGIMFFGFLKFKDFFKSSEVIVPNFVGMPIEEAEKKAKDLDLKLVIKDRIQSDEFEEGKVVKQNQEKNSKVKSGYTIEVVISEGGKLIRVPSFVNQTLDEAMDKIEELGFELGETKYEFSDTFPTETIMEQRPEAYTYLAKGDKVILVISKGEEIKSVIMPRVVGRNITEAKNKILSLGLTIGNIKEEYNNDYPEGVVYFQSYDEGRELKLNTSIDLYVSKGKQFIPEPTPEPKPEPKPEPEPQPEPIPEPELTEGKIRFIIKLPTKEEGEQVEVNIIKIQEGKTEQVYYKEHVANGNEIEVVSKGKKGSKFEIYFDNILQETKIKKE
ncbi:serine/threonine-protein kinase PrkC [Tissierella creatinophila DSM 6911]|uniref:non-specific serine/threonine protein kinase n=2 Tax=Tissierella creatinophila TaxID=79681 RepID=A0A1U7M316_TISCR|nr:serine/threonine-protein kinase PrkC [Tissierella creatinophila DSM 6911]